MNPLRMDPTRTKTLRDQFGADILRRLRRLKAKINQLIVDEDAFGWKPVSHNPFVGNRRHEYSSTQLNLEGSLKRAVLRLASSISVDDLADKGRETEPHITVRYGLHEETAERVALVASVSGPISAKLGPISVFEGDGYDVVKVEVESESLRRLNEALGALPHTDTHATYSPHLTLAYVKPGRGAKYAGSHVLEGKEIRFDLLQFSDKDRTKVGIPLNGPIANTRWRFRTSSQQLEAFQQWLTGQVEQELFEKVEDANWFDRYIQAGYDRGRIRAFDAVNKPELEESLDFYAGTRREFLRSAFMRPVSSERVKLLASRVYTDLRGISSAISNELSRRLVDGMIRGDSPREVARVINQEIDSIGRKRALVLARTETIRAHNEGQLDALEAMGVEEVGVAVEWSVSGMGVTAKGNPSPCKLCAPLKGIVLKTKEAHGLLPRHPNCMCSFIPANVGESGEGQLRTKKRITEAINRSIKAEIPKKSKRTIAQQRKRSRWAGAGAKIDPKRPKSIL